MTDIMKADGSNAPHETVTAQGWHFLDTELPSMVDKAIRSLRGPKNYELRFPLIIQGMSEPISTFVVLAWIAPGQTPVFRGWWEEMRDGTRRNERPGRP